MKVWVWRDYSNQVEVSPKEPLITLNERTFYDHVEAISLCFKFARRVFPNVKFGTSPKVFEVTAKEVK